MRTLLFLIALFAMTPVHAGQALDTCCRLTAFNPGKTMELQIAVTNLQDQSLLIHQTLAEWDLRLDIRDANGQQVTLTDYGRHVATVERSGSLRKHTLARDQQFTQSIDLGKVYELTSGSYSITVFRDVFLGEKTVELKTTTTIRIP